MREWDELVSLALVELVLELNPVETQVMQEALHHIHKHQYKEGNCRKQKEGYNHLKESWTLNDEYLPSRLSSLQELHRLFSQRKL